MDGPALGEHATADMHDLEARGFEHFLRRFFHVFGHAVFVVAEFVMEAQRGDAPFIFYDGIEIDIVFISCEDFSERPHADEGALILADFLLEGGAETMGVCAARKHGTADSAFESVAADKFGMLLGQIAEEREIEAAGTAVVERWRLADKILGPASDAGSHDVLAEIVADVAAGVGQA